MRLGWSVIALQMPGLRMIFAENRCTLFRIMRRIEFRSTEFL
jgi:hypothetical protein